MLILQENVFADLREIPEFLSVHSESSVLQWQNKLVVQKDTITNQEKVIGNAEIRQTFKISNVGTIGGAYVLDGKLERNAGVRILRDNVVIHEGKLASLKRFKDDAKEVSKGFECGIQIEKYNDIKEGDIIEAYILEEIKR